MAAVSVKRSILFRCHCPSSGSLILSGQIVHINEAKANWPFTTKDNVLVTPRPSYSSTVIGVRAGGGGEGGCSPPKFWATHIFWAAREKLGKASFLTRFRVF